MSHPAAPPRTVGREKSSILVVGPAWVGDMVMAQSLFIRLKQLHPDAEIDVLAPKWSLPLLARMPEVREGVEMPLGHGELGLCVRRRLGHALRQKNYHRAIILPRSFKAALVPWFANIPHRTGFKGELRYGLINDIRPLDKSLLTQTVQRFVALGEDQAPAVVPDVPSPAMTVDENNRQRIINALGLSVDQPVIGMMPGAEYGPAKQWPPEYYAELARKLGEQGYASWVFGSAKEQPLGDQIVSAGGDLAVNLCGRTQLADVVDLLSLCKSTVTNDSGLMHVAGAVGTKVIAIYGSSSPLFTPPLGDKQEVVWLNIDCAPCFERECPFGHYNCLKQIEVQRILDLALA